MNMAAELVLKDVTKTYTVDGNDILALENISFSVKKRESIAIVGPSGCGKTTLIRIICGLEKTTNGSVTFLNKEISAPDKQIMMVFQSVAILPWKTVQQNVELALLDKNEEERKKIASRFIELVGLEGFANSFPKELSGGMKQRVGIARAICREPEVLVLDEPFSALDTLTANNLRNEVLRFYLSKKNKPNVLILVTHSIEEAVYMSDRVIVLSKRPAKIVEDIKIDLPFPRDRRDSRFYEYVDRITALIT